MRTPTPTLRYVEKGGYTLAYPRSARELKGARKAIDARKAQGLNLNAMEGYVPKSLNEICEFCDIEAVAVGAAPGMSMADIEKFERLKCLLVGSEFEDLDLSELRHLEILAFCATKNSDVTVPLAKLRRLSVSKSRVTDLEFLKRYPQLKELWFYAARSLVSLAGASTPVGLTSVQIGNTPKLQELHDIGRCKALEVLELGPFKNVIDFSPIFKVPTLKKLIFSQCGSIATLKDLPNLRRLEHFALSDTDVADRDIGPVLEVRSLKYFGAYRPRKYFRPSAVTVERTIAERHSSGSAPKGP